MKMISNSARGRTNVEQNRNDIALGEIVMGADVDDTTTIGPAPKLSEMPVFLRKVKGSGALTPGRRVKYTSGNFGIEVEAAGAEQAHGVVDPLIPSTTADGDEFMIVIEGPVDLVSSAAISANAKVEGATSGRAVTATSGIVEGRAIEAAGAGDTVFRAYTKFPQN